MCKQTIILWYIIPVCDHLPDVTVQLFALRFLMPVFVSTHSLYLSSLFKGHAVVMVMNGVMPNKW